MSRTMKRTPLKWEKGRGDKCCPGPESCLPCARPVLGASVSEWHIRPWDGCHGAQRQGGVYLCQAPGGMVARGSGCAHRFSPKLGNPGIASVWDWRVVASNTYPPNHLLLKTTTRMWLQKRLFGTVDVPGITYKWSRCTLAAYKTVLYKRVATVEI